MKLWLAILLSVSLSVSTVVSAFAHTDMHLAHGSDGVGETFNDLSITLHKFMFPHDLHDHDHHHDHSHDDENSDHGPEDHRTHCLACAFTSVLVPFADSIWNKSFISFEADTFLPEPLYLIEHVPE